MDVHEFICKAGFISNGTVPLKSGKLVRSERAFYYRVLRGNIGIDLVTCSGRYEEGELRFFTYPIGDFLRGVDLDEETPSSQGQEAVRIIKAKYIDRAESRA